jgi:hypothetical protein
MNEWNNFFTVSASAAAALAGLIFVGVSISLTRILSLPQLPGRALGSLILMLNVLIIGLLCLIPHQPEYLGIEVLVIGTGVWLVTLRLDLSLIRKSEAIHKKHSWQNIVFTQFSLLPYIIGGITILCEGYTGLYWLVPGVVFSFIKTVTDAWVLLVEIHR